MFVSVISIHFDSKDSLAVFACVHTACNSDAFFAFPQLDYLQSRDYFAQIKKLEKSITAEEKEIEKLRDFEKAHLEVCICSAAEVGAGDKLPQSLKVQRA